MNATLNGTTVDAIDVNKTVCIWIHDFIMAGCNVDTIDATNHVYSVNGGKHVTGVVNNAKVYLPWNAAPNTTYTHEKKPDGVYAFTIGKVEQPTPAPTQPAQKTVFATIQGRVLNNAIFFTLDGPNGVGNIQLDTGAFRLTINSGLAQAMGLQNLGPIDVAGVGGADTGAYMVKMDIKIGDRLYTGVDAVADPNFTGCDGLFGAEWFIKNNIALGVDFETGLITFAA